MRLLVTGATGFIGRHVRNRFVARGDDVRVLALPGTVAEVTPADRVEIVVGDLSDSAALRKATRGVQVVLHLAARVPGATPRELRDVNVRGTRLLLAAAADASVRSFVFMSSTAVYGLSPFPRMWPIGEGSSLAAHGAPALREYGQSKIDAEQAVREENRRSGLEYVILRPSLTYGRGATAVEPLLRRLLRSPAAFRTVLAAVGAIQWVHISDLVEVAVRAATRRAAANEIFNVAGPEVLTAGELAAVLRATVGGGWRPGWALHPGGRWHSVLRFDCTKVARVLGYAPRVRFEEGLREMFHRTDGEWAGIQEDQHRRGPDEP